MAYYGVEPDDFVDLITKRRQYSASSNQTDFLFEWANGTVDVFVNGVKLFPNDYTTPDDTTVRLNTPIENGDNVEIIAYNANKAIVTDTYTTGEIEAGFVATEGDTESVWTGTSGNTPTAGVSGRYLIETDTQRVYYDNGTSLTLLGFNPIANVAPYYYGVVGTGSPASLFGGPSGWTVEHIQPGVYEIVHNLGLNTPDDLFLVAQDSIDAENVLVTYHIGNSTSNRAQMRVKDVVNDTLIDEDFQFAFMNVNYTP